MKQVMLAILIAVAWVLPVKALELDAPFENIDGGELQLSQWQGQPVLVVNTASRCAYTKQYSQLQSLYDQYRDQGLVVLAVPSNDFRQELGSEEEVKAFCEIQFGLDLPMTGITRVKGKDAHPFFRSLAQEEGFRPKWNFNKVLIAPDGSLVKTFGSKTAPLSGAITSQIEAFLQ
ncbi:glutathione peroxidase [Shimia thalassica]|uniref:glutathione peroxidase n=1 Tax=Shimia thalassica TaxID=1715693 RepID=UPI000C07C072|nr:glutathione peroxidase [Shimia thalassica]MDO6480830.1 glutathione peroxidase [Shimia thalassica]PHO05631.1 glutathione peroxidase [Rhodobacteraceae bacterium 4F10]